MGRSVAASDAYNMESGRRARGLRQLIPFRSLSFVSFVAVVPLVPVVIAVSFVVVPLLSSAAFAQT
jgi:hypothetical protein